MSNRSAPTLALLGADVELLLGALRAEDDRHVRLVVVLEPEDRPPAARLLVGLSIAVRAGKAGMPSDGRLALVQVRPMLTRAGRS